MIPTTVGLVVGQMMGWSIVGIISAITMRTEEKLKDTPHLSKTLTHGDSGCYDHSDSVEGDDVCGEDESVAEEVMDHEWETSGGRKVNSCQEDKEPVIILK